MSRAMRQTAEEIREHLNNYRRDPFQNELSKLLVNSPNPSSIKAFANKSPDRWAQSIAIMAKIAGFHERLEVDIKFKPLTSMADSELRNMLQELNKKLDRIEINTESNKVIDTAKHIEHCAVIEDLSQADDDTWLTHKDPSQDTDIT